jgi:dolichol-phosphate mannosyltransferase
MRFEEVGGMDISVIVPTYREAENLPVLVRAVAGALGGTAGGYEIVVVDDNSCDGTEEACALLAGTYPLHLLVRRDERGLASAVVHGMRQARGTWLVVMDADLSHPPEAIPSLLASLREGRADFVIGSRYVAGGSTEEGWGVYRWLNSKVATVLAWPLARVRDPMAGFFALPRQLFQSAAPLDPIGYKIGLELLVKCRCRRVVEVPIHFRNRLHGQSKLNLREQFNYLRHLLRLYRFRLSHPASAQMQRPEAT